MNITLFEPTIVSDPQNGLATEQDPNIHRAVTWRFIYEINLDADEDEECR